MQKVVGTTADLSPGEMMEAEFNGRSIVVCRASDGEFHAFTNVCPHQGAPLSKGKLCGAPVATEQIGEYDFQHEGDILRCPWHGREFNIKNEGRTLAADGKQKLREYKLSIEDEQIMIHK